jgi:integrase
VLDDLAAYLAAYPSDDALFLDAEGAPLEYPGWQRVWRPARTKAGSEMSTHDFRHF